MDILLSLLSNIISPDIEIYMSYISYDGYSFYREYKDINCKLDRIFGPAYIKYWYLARKYRPDTIIWYQHGLKT